MSDITTVPTAKLGKQGWMVQCASGPLADAFAHMAGVGTPTVDAEGGALILYTRQLDRRIIRLVDALIHLRYDANRVKLALFEAEVQE